MVIHGAAPAYWSPFISLVVPEAFLNEDICLFFSFNDLLDWTIKFAPKYTLLFHFFMVISSIKCLLH